MSSFDEDRARHVTALQNRLPSEVDTVTWNLPRLWARRDERLRRVLAHARQNSSWHRPRLRHLDLETCSAKDLTTVAPMTKADLMEHWDEIVTDRRLTLARVTAHLRDVDSGKMAYLDGEFVAAATSGSSGPHAVIVRDFDGLLESALANIRNVEWLKRGRGIPRGTADRQARLFARSPVHISSVIGRVFERHERTSVTLPPSMPASVLADELVAFNPTRIIGYPSVLHRVAVELLDHRRALSPWDVATNGEALLPEARAAIEAAFGVPVRNIYGMTETGTIAESHPPHPSLQLIEDVVVLEPGPPTMVTNIVNLVLPLIRYEIDDRVDITDRPHPGEATGRVLADVPGRAPESFAYPGGVIIDASIFLSALSADPSVVEYQVRQAADGAEVRVVTAGPSFDPHALENRIRSELEAAGLASPRACVISVDHLDRDSPTQKLRRFIPTQAPAPEAPPVRSPPQDSPGRRPS